MKNLPYMRWFPADADGDEKYASLNDEDLGFFHRLLNKSWINTGLPADLDELAGLMHISRAQLNKRWKKVGRCWNQDGERLFNPRQEVERAYAIRKSERATESVQTRYRKATSVGTDEGSNELRTTYQSESESESEGRIETHTQFSGTTQAAPEKPVACASELPIPAPRKLAAVPISGEAFHRWLDAWPSCADRDGAARAWISRIDNPDQESAAFACRDRYLASEQVSRGIIQEPKKFIMVQADCGWSGTWISDTTQLDQSISVLKGIELRIKEMDEHDRRNGSKSGSGKAKGFERISETAGRCGINPRGNGKLA